MQKRRLQYRKSAYLLSFLCLALVSTSNLRTQTTEASAGKSVKSVAQSPTTAVTKGRYNGKLVFSSDRQADGGSKLWTMNPDGSSQTQLTFESERGPTLPSYVPVYDDFCKWSPDGTKIALRSNRNFDLNNPYLDAYTIYVMDYQGNNVQRLILDQLPILSSQTDAEIGSVEWSPDGTKFAFHYGQGLSSGIVGEDSTGVNVYTVNTDGSGLKRQTFDGASGAPTWSPDGNQILFLSASWAIDVMNSDGSNRREVARVTNIIGDVAWSPDGSKLLFAKMVTRWSEDRICAAFGRA